MAASEGTQKGSANNVRLALGVHLKVKPDKGKSPQSSGGVAGGRNPLIAGLIGTLVGIDGAVQKWNRLSQLTAMKLPNFIL